MKRRLGMERIVGIDSPLCTESCSEEMMSRHFSKSRVAILLVVVLMIWDYWRVDARDRRVSAAVARCGGRMSSLPFWPLGAEYRISATRAWTEKELESLSELNTLRGKVMIAFVDCEMTQHELDIATKHLANCHLFRISNGFVIPWTAGTNGARTDLP